MADVNIDMLLSDSTRSIGRRRREVQALNQELERARGLMASQAGGGGGGEREGYDRARGAIGTGAAGRDFANQSRGLGGVVALYATFAANIFAVSSAFRALQEAANFERLIKASELMSERTGINIKGLGKNLQEAAGYAISFEDAMQFANLGTSAGIAAKQLESLVGIAKGAAAGLGRDVNDSVRRIIQGTAKQEQEILDELGIFIKAKRAYDDYAKKFQIAGGADVLSAQQRVAAYADAVEAAGMKWKDFAKLDDPFSRFVATGKEALTTLLNFINKGVEPLLRVLADSKGAVIALAAAISLSLARRALPELKNLFTDLFTYNKSRMRAQAQQQRIDIGRELALTSNAIQAEQAKLAAIQAAPPVSPAIVNTSLLQQEAIRQEILRLTNAQAAAQQRMAATTPSNIQATSRFPTAPSAPGVISRTAGATMAAVSSVYQPITTAFTKAVAEIGENSKQMSNVIGGGFVVNLKQAGLVLRDHIKVLGTFGRELGTATGMMLTARNATTAWAAAQVAGLSAVSLASAAGAAALSTLGLALKGLMAALGPLMLLWTAWELILKDLILDDVSKETIELTKKLKELEDASKSAGAALASINNKLYDGIQNQQDYAKVIEITKNSITSQIDAIDKLFKQRQKLDDIEQSKKAQKEYAEEGKFYSAEIYAIDQLIAANERLQLADKQTVEALIAGRKRLEDAQKKKASADLKAEILLPATIRNFLGTYSQGQKESREGVLKATRDLQDPLGDIGAAAQRREALQSEINTGSKAMDDAIEDIRKKLKKIPQFGEIATNETSKIFADGFAKYAKIFRDGKAQVDTQGIAANYDGMIQKLQELAPVSSIAAQAVKDLNDAQALGVDISGLYQTALSYIPQIIKELNDRFAQYSAASLSYFNSLEKSINNFTLSIMRQDAEISKTSAFNDRIEALRGFATEQEILSAKTQQIQKAELQYSKELKQAQLDYEKVTRQGRDTQGKAATAEELAAAEEKLRFAKEQARLTRNQNVLSANTTAENKTLDNILKQVSDKYEIINRQLQLQNARAEVSLRLEQERLRILKEAGALSEPRIVEMETQTQGSQIQQTFKESSVAASNAAEEERAKIQERYNLAIKDAGFDLNKISMAIQAQGEARSKVNAKERDALTLAGLRRDNELEILRISSEARKVYAELAEAEKTRAQQEALRATKLEAEKQLVDLQKEELQYKLDLGLITQDLYDKEVNGINKAIRAREYQNKLLEIEAKYKREIDKVAADATVAGIPGGLDETGTGIIELEQAEGFNKRKEAAKSQRDAEIKGAQDVYNANERVGALYETMSTEQKGLASIYKDTFASMADSIVQFVRTGKLSFKDLINDMLASILRLYTNKIFTNLFSSMLPGLPGMGTPGQTSVMGVPNALGNVYSDKGLQKFAKGGTFTNSIVDSPTLFKFAKGTGMMGEAGPEAIMPLKRDSQGNLGVRAQNGGNVEVVVNNYSSEKAEARETTDSRGNRRIEVVVGDMTAGEVTRGGSSTNRAITNTFGMKPQLIRR